jgi:cytochrome c oxidase subunit 1
MSTVTTDTHSTSAEGAHAHTAGFLQTYVFSLDHKIIGLQFLFSTLIWFVVGGLLALGIRWQLAFPWRSMPFLGEWLASPEGGANRTRKLHDAGDHARIDHDLLCDYSSVGRRVW